MIRYIEVHTNKEIEISKMEKLCWVCCKFKEVEETIIGLRLLSIDEIKNSTFFRRKTILDDRYLVYFNQNNLGFYFDTESLKGFEITIEDIEDQLIDNIVNIKKEK